MNGIEIIFSNRCKRGRYDFIDEKHTITLSSDLSATERRFVGWHEFAHFLQNFYARRPTRAYASCGSSKGSEKLADVFALVAGNPDRVSLTGGQDFIYMLMTESEVE